MTLDEAKRELAQLLWMITHKADGSPGVIDGKDMKIWHERVYALAASEDLDYKQLLQELSALAGWNGKGWN